MPLKSRTTTYIEVDYSDLDAFISEVYGHDFESAACEEWSNDSQHKIIIPGKYVFSDDDYESIQRFRRGDGYDSFILRAIMQNMVNNDVLPPGNYLISVSW